MDRVFHMLIGSSLVCEMKISYVKMFQSHTFFTCEITSEILYGRANRFPHCLSAGKPVQRFAILTTRRKGKDVFCLHVQVTNKLFLELTFQVDVAPLAGVDNVVFPTVNNLVMHIVSNVELHIVKLTFQNYNIIV